MSQTAAQTSPAPAAEIGPKLYVVEPGIFAREFWLLRRAVVAAQEDNCFSIAKGAAYSFLLSLFPIITTLTAVLIHAQAQSVVPGHLELHLPDRAARN